MDDRLLALQLASWLEANLRDAATGTELEKVSGYSDNRLRQKFFSATGETPASYLRKRRLTEAAKDLMQGNAIVDVADRYGYSSQENFTTAFKSLFALNPGELKSMDKKYRDFLSRMKEPLTIMELTNLKQGDLCTTLMGSVKGASDYFDLDWSVAKLFGYSGMAFMLNIHRDLCPSGPYAWNKDIFYLRLRDMGIRKVKTLGIVKDTPASELRKIENELRAWLDAGKVAMMEFLEYQLVLGYDERGLVLLRSWGDDCGGTEIKAVSFGNWAECLDREGWVYFTLLEKEELRADERSLLRSALDTAQRIRTAPEDFRKADYAVGDAAWETWLSGIDRGFGSQHGNWWNGMVWAECRAMASAFFTEVQAMVGGERAPSLCAALSETYRACAEEISTAKDKDATAAWQRAALRKGRDLDREAERLIRDLVSIL